MREYTNASFLIHPDFELPGDNQGVFSGLKGTETTEGFVDGKYDKTTWAYQQDEKGTILKDKTLQDPQLRLPTAEKTLLPLQPGDRLVHHRNAAG